jgi:hypothetical protein
MSAFEPTLLEKELAEISIVETPSGPALIEFHKPSEIVAYQPPDGLVLVGERHIVRGSPFVIGGAPGVGKSRASVALAVAGAMGLPWFGLHVHRKFRTMIVQNENGRLRLKDEFAELPAAQLDEWVRISPPPPYGFALENPEFMESLRLSCDQFQPDVVIFDPWNAAARDDKASDYLATFKAIQSVIPKGDGGPALGIVAHTRKPKSDERTNGRGLLNLLAGSYVLASVPRAAYVIQAASENPEDSRIVFTCCKNSDGPMGAPSAWERRNGVFAPVSDFDWDEFNGKSGKEGERVRVSEDDMAKVLPPGSRKARHLVVSQLRENTGCGQTAAYSAVALDGRFKGRITQDTDGFLQWS